MGDCRTNIGATDDAAGRLMVFSASSHPAPWNMRGERLKVGQLDAGIGALLKRSAMWLQEIAFSYFRNIATALEWSQFAAGGLRPS